MLPILEGEVVTPRVVDMRDTERRLFEYYTRGGVQATHGRIVREGQIWRSNDPRRFRGVGIIGFRFGRQNLMVEAVGITAPHIKTLISINSFTVGPRGWSLEKEAV